MGSPSELRLHYKPTGGCSGAAAENPPTGDQPEQYRKLEEFLARLEEERRKIELLKRELPLCMQLLNGAMETYKQQLEMYHAQQGSGPVLEEFMPLRSAAAAAEEPDKPRPAANVVACEKATWMTSAQLWNPTDGAAAPCARHPVASQLRESDHLLDAVPRIALDHKQRGGGAFLPFSRDRGSVVLPELALAGGGDLKEPGEKKFSSLLEAAGGESYGAKKGGGSTAGTEQGQAGAAVPASAAATAADGGPAAAAAQTQRKARRCWSPELHRRFVNALQMLGGSQVATPKQIRELMKVDGLTNDEVKSHLQKYRLHTRRPIPAPPAGAAAAAPQLVVLGGIWVPPEYAATAAAAPAIYGHPPPARYCAAPVPRDFYTPPPPPAAHQHQDSPSSQRHRVAAEAVPFAAMRPTGVVKRRSPEPDVRERGDDSDQSIENMEERTEQEEDEEEEEEGARSDSSGWKRGDEKALIPVAEAGEVSNGSDVVLKF